MGKQMLLEQAKEQQRIWLGKSPPHDEMKAALEQFAAQVATGNGT
jgi:shikimate 5-dehydrogenase